MKDKIKLYVVSIIILGILMAGVVIYNSNKLSSQADRNNETIKVLVSLLDSSSLFTISTDSLGKARIDSVRLYPTELRTLITDKTIDRLTGYNKSLSETASSTSNSLILWATLLTLLSIMFTFLGLIELKDRLNKVEDGVKELEEKKREITAMQLNIDNQSETINKQVDSIEKKSRLSQFNLELQMLLLLYSNDKSKDTTILNQSYSLIEKIENDNFATEDDFKMIICRVYYSTMDILKESKEYEKALDDGYKALSIAPYNPETYNRIANVFDKQENYEQAINYYTKSIDLDPSFLTPLLNRAFVYKHMGKSNEDKRQYYYTKSIEDLQKVLEYNPKANINNWLITNIEEMESDL